MASDTKKQVIPNDRLSNERKKRHWTQSDVASELYGRCSEEEFEEHGTIDGNMVSKWERGLHIPSPFWRRKICELFGKDAAELGLINEQDNRKSTEEEASLPLESSAESEKAPPIQIIIPKASLVTVQIRQTSISASPAKDDMITIEEPSYLAILSPESSIYMD